MSRSIWRAIDDRSTGERKFSERKRIAAKSKSGKGIMSYFRSDDIESTSPTRDIWEEWNSVKFIPSHQKSFINKNCGRITWDNWIINN